MTTVIDPFTGKPDIGRERDERLESQLDSAFAAMTHAPNDAKSQELLTEFAVLLRRRAPHQVLRFELERRRAL